MSVTNTTLPRSGLLEQVDKLTVGLARKRAALPQLIRGAVSIIRIEEMAGGKHAD